MRLQRLYSLVLLVVSINASAQELKVDLSYNYIYSNQLDKIIQKHVHLLLGLDAKLHRHHVIRVGEFAQLGCVN